MSETANRTWSYFGPEFQQKVIWQLLVEPEFAKGVISKIAVEYFDDPYLKRLFIIMLEYYNEHDRVPNLQNKSIEEAVYRYKSPTNEIEGQVLMGKIDQVKLWNERVINKNQLYDGDIVRDNIFEFIKQQEYRKLAEHIISKVKDGGVRQKTFNFETGEKFNKIYHIGDDEDYGSDVVDDIDHALSDEFRDTIPTGIEVIDHCTGNGLGRGEIGLVLAPSGIGKTTVLTKIANTAFNEKKKVLQIIFEDTVRQVQRKHYTIWSKVAQSKIKDNKQLVKDRVLAHVKNIKEQGGKLDIIRMNQENTTMHDIKSWIERQHKKFGYKYDEIVLDYLDCLEPNKTTQDLLASELSIVKSFEAMAGEYNIPCWSALQTNRSGFKVDFVDADNTGGNIKRVQKSHFVMSIAKPAKSDNDKIANIKIIKARFAEDGQEFKDCIFNNDTLEIKITDHKYTSQLTVKKVSDDDIQALEEKTLKLVEGFNHAPVAEKGGMDYGPTVGDVAKANEDLTMNTEFDAKREEPEKGNIEIGMDSALNTTTGGESGPFGDAVNVSDERKMVMPEKIPVEITKLEPLPIPPEPTLSVGNINPADFFAKICGGGDEKPQDEWDKRLKQQRNEQGNVFKE